MMKRRTVKIYMLGNHLESVKESSGSVVGDSGFDSVLLEEEEPCEYWFCWWGVLDFDTTLLPMC